MTTDLEILNIILANANIPKRYQHNRLDDCLRHEGWRKSFGRLQDLILGQRHGSISVLCGARGTGKTQLACEIIRAAAQQRFFSRYEVFLDYLDTVRRMNDQPAVDDHDVRYHAPRLVVLDEIAKGGESAWAEQRLFHLVNHRYNDLKHTILITAAPPEAVPAIVGPSVADRINEGGTVIHLDWPSFRSNTMKTT